MKLLSEASEYGLRAIVWLAHNSEQNQKVREIALGTHAAPGYLIKVLQSLAKAGILTAQRGSQGGFSLRRDPRTLTVLEVVNAIDPIERIHACPLGRPEHSGHLCPMHKRIDDALVLIEQSFAASTIADLMTEPAAPEASGCAALCAGAGRAPGIDKGGT